MSELNSLYVEIRVTKDRLERFFQEKPLPQTVDDNWRTWWNSREMYGKQELEDIPVYRTHNNRQLLDELLNDEVSVCAEHYEPASQNWTFVSVFFSENYTEILPIMAVIALVIVGGIGLFIFFLYATDPLAGNARHHLLCTAQGGMVVVKGT